MHDHEGWKEAMVAIKKGQGVKNFFFENAQAAAGIPGTIP